MAWPEVTERVRLYENPYEENEEMMGEHPDLTPLPAADPFDDDEPIVASCDLENPESCESCT